MKLIREYKASLRMVNKAKAKADADDEAYKKLLRNCADSLSYSLEYMVKGREPGNRRAITRRSGTQREIPVSPENISFIRAAVLQRKLADDLSEEQKELLADLLEILTPKEKEAFVMIRGNGYSFSEAAEIMKVTKGTVQNLVARAEEKFGFVVRKDEIKEDIVFEKPVQRVLFL